MISTIILETFNDGTPKKMLFAVNTILETTFTGLGRMASSGREPDNFHHLSDSHFTLREHEILQLIVMGKGDSEIAE